MHRLLPSGILCVAICSGLLNAMTLPAFAQPAGATATTPPAAAADSQAAVIERLPLVLRDPRSYQTPLSLAPASAIDLVAHFDGIVSAVQVQPGQAAARQSELVRLESTELQLQLDRAKAARDAAQDQGEAAKEVANLDVKIAEYRLEQAIIRATFDGTITQIHVVPGQFVRAGDPLVRLADLRKLKVAMPVDRSTVKTGATLDVKVEDQSASGQVQSIQPLLSQFEPLRELFVSVATAVVTVDNANGKFSDGQTVYSSLIPRTPVAEVPTLAVGGNAEGSRRVQVIREGFVRDVAVELLGQSGTDYVFVTGRFGPTDELVVKSSKDLRDGMRVLPATVAGGGNSTPNPARSPSGAAGQGTTPGF
ncbi:MAG: HlyD family efflux transporter periplasmic adaptor subunit [Planctomycetaceae bacterium]|nr:HlyD family efflux transporter periplasmic adaptor subunit [Planctomycetaceae bacterium]